MRAAPTHHSSEHATGPGADPVRDLGKGQLTDRSGAQVGDTPALLNTKREVERFFLISFSSDCALWKEGPCPQLGSWRPATATLLWEPRGSRNFHMRHF